MDLIEKLNPVDFKMYLQRTENTICGRHPISVLLNVILAFLTSLFIFHFIYFFICYSFSILLFIFYFIFFYILFIFSNQIIPYNRLFQIIDSLKGSPACELRFTHYAQSSRCKRSRDSSVSYASASCVLK
jgi:predicted class III extradiol MEMO1 family dioxygenase